MSFNYMTSGFIKEESLTDIRTFQTNAFTWLQHLLNLSMHMPLEFVKSSLHMTEMHYLGDQVSVLLYVFGEDCFSYLSR